MVGPACERDAIEDGEEVMTAETTMQRMKATIRGAVQGVGFRPFVFRLATSMGLRGWVSNSSQGVEIDVEGTAGALRGFLGRLGNEKPPRSFIQSLEYSYLDPVGHHGFEIRESDTSGKKSAIVLADIATCPDCLNDIFDPGNRRYLYPFTNCTNCGPRYSIIEALPYDRPNTSMKQFDMCEECRREYENPHDRRFHAQPNACPTCGPQLYLWKRNGETIARHQMALLVGADIIRRGGILAMKGLGGFHLLADARNENVVRLLRRRKHREEKPLAVMFDSLDSIRSECMVSDGEQRLLTSPEAPIVLLEKSGSAAHIAPSVAPGNPYLGAMLPCTPLHHLLMRELGFPVVATSGNVSDEPICTDEHEALDRLQNIADAFLVHNRPIVRHVDDSVVRMMAGRPMVIRRARGYAPLPVAIKEERTILAVGAHLKNTVALSTNGNVFISQHIGDLETGEAFEAFRKVTSDLQQLYDVRPSAVVCDMHPEYLSTKHAASLDVPSTSIQHHHAHVVSCMAENELDGRVLGVSWDGTGYGPDGTIWGGEFLLCEPGSFVRVASFKPFRLPGGDKAVKEPRRTAMGVHYEMLGESLFLMTDLHTVQAFSDQELRILQTMLATGTNSPWTTSAGRLFDAVASIIGLRQKAGFEGQAAMELEFAMEGAPADAAYKCTITDQQISGRESFRPAHVLDWSQLIQEVLHDSIAGLPRAVISRKFHNALADAIIAIAELCGEERVVLSGGCFQNKYLTERTIARLCAKGFRPYWHQRVPPNDGGLALGQVYAASKAPGHHRQMDIQFAPASTTQHHVEEEVT